MRLNNIKYLFILAAGLSLHSCLDLEPQDQLGENKMWQSPNDYQSFANNFYSWTADFGSVVRNGGYHNDLSSDLMTAASADVISQGNNTQPSSDGVYTGDYAHIRRCNMLLQRAANYPNPEDIKQYVGEAYFFRAYSYFDLLLTFGNVILTTEPLTTDDPKMQVAQNDRKEIVDTIVSDLNKAAENLPDFKALTTNENGRLSKQAAQAFLSRVALYEGTWQKFHKDGDATRAKELLNTAATAAKAVIDSKEFWLFGTDEKTKVLGDSAQKYMFVLENTKSNPAGIQKADNHEYIFTRRHDQTLAAIGWNITKTCIDNVQWVTSKFANMYLCTDGLPVDKSSRFEGYSKMTSEWANRDNRMRYTLLEPGTHYFTNLTPRTNWDDTDFEGTTLLASPHGSGYMHQKWATERSCADGQEGYDFPIIRYAEVLLNYAEAVYERDDKISDDDLAYLNEVRLRVNRDNGMPALSNAFVSAHGLDMRTEIRRERTIELFQEGFRLDDLKRWATAVEEMNQPLLGVKFTGTEFEQKWTGGKPSQATDADGRLIMDSNRKWTDKNYLFPLPSDQLTLNKNLVQNPGWK